ncbi:hypothetical protein ACFVJM_37830, partial [Streptomyces virginiae]|uniref:hypothetical protein n=1 Tax=Streptomyces virginiae TaxID=1961 RepID=UPI003637AB12
MAHGSVACPARGAAAGAAAAGGAAAGGAAAGGAGASGAGAVSPYQLREKWSKAAAGYADQA